MTRRGKPPSHGRLERGRAGAGAWWRLPAALTRVVLRRRTWQPAARFYLIVAAAGTGVGLVVRFTVGWPWWWGPVLAVAVGWLLMLSTAFLGGKAPMGGLRDELLDVIDPAGAARRRPDATRRRLRAARLPLYGVEGWTGPRYVSGSGWSKGRTVFSRGATSVTLRHVTPDGNGQVEVEIARRGVHSAPDPFRAVNHLEDHSPEAAPLDMQQVLARQETLSIPVDGQPTPFQLLRHGQAAAAHADLGGVLVLVASRTVPLAELRLVRVEDPSPYL